MYISPCFTERSRAAEEAAPYNCILDEIKDNSTLPSVITTNSGIMEVKGNKRPRTLPPRPQYQSIDPLSIDPVNHQRRDNGMYKELDFGTLNDGQNYENPDEGRADFEKKYLEPVNETNLPTRNSASNVCDNRDEGKDDLDENLEPVNEKSMPTGNSATNSYEAPDEGEVDPDEYLAPAVNDTNLQTGITTSNFSNAPGEGGAGPDVDPDCYLELVNDINLLTENPSTNICDSLDEDKINMDGYLEPVNDTSLRTGNSTSNVSDDSKIDPEYLELVGDTNLLSI